ncbi:MULTISPECIES: pyridoxamine 5'-phosphate oxidase family protein [Luteimonas]|jgi:general stress protein 26|uniref:pyridoxamine 5'-phosphate oxidase family protein n=1 Tax=Luteimonas TaxID=83614 RepID=UPI000C7B4B47|nr:MULTISPECIES: pyridoxamine 5'-phosphate oxidase family protein [Luteimonas]
MDSINRNQPEHNRQDLAGADAISRIQDMSDDADSCFFCTTPLARSETGGSRPMSIQKADAAGVLWFMSASDSHKNAEIEADPHVRLFLQSSKHSGFLALEGTATISRDRAKIEELWNPILKTWFTEGKDDPRITVIEVNPTAGYYWDNKHGDFVAATKMAIGAALGKTLDDSIEGNITP